jgi:hypothetical protein
MGKPIKEDGYFVVYHWMSKLRIISEEKKKKPKTDENGNIITEPLSGVAKELYAIIYRWSLGKAGCCYYSYAQFEEITGSSNSTIMRSLDRLCRNDLILIECIAHNEDKNGRAKIISKRYRVNVNKIKELGVTIPKKLEENEHGRNVWNDFIGGDDEDLGDEIEQIDFQSGNRVF